MLTPQLRSSLSATRQRSLAYTTGLLSSPHTARVGTAFEQSRNFWGWRRPNDYASHIDPLYHRFAKYRTLKTKAKLMEKLRRRGRFEWDLDQKPFFAPRNIRWASFYNGKPTSTRWMRSVHEEDGNKQESRQATTGESHELKPEEREWKEQMEALRKRVEKDPYEAVFGKRFEPFYSPLVPSWMREEMGLQGWPKTTPASSLNASEDVPVAKAKNVSSNDVVQESPKHAVESSESTKAMSSTDGQTTPELTTQPATFSSVSSTSWDSWTNKTRRTEWDSASGETKRWEYDPISNRMVQTAGPVISKPTEEKARHNDMQSLINTPSRELAPKAVEIPVKKSIDVRKAIPIPQQPTQMTTTKATNRIPSSDGTVSNRSSTPKPAALATLPKNDLDLLTADNVRASMGKVKQPSSAVKPTTPSEKAAMEAAFDNQKPPRSELEEIEAVSQITDKGILEDYVASISEARYKLRKRMHDHAARNKVTDVKLEASLDRFQPPKVEEPASATLQPALDRMQSGEQSKVTEYDDAAAHESTEPIESSSVPQDWSKQADLLQSERVKRTAGKRPYPMTRWVDDMQARKAAYEASKIPSEAEQATASDKSAKLEKANALLAAEVQEQKSLMQSHENRYVHKIRSLRQELEAAYKQSAIHSEMHMDRIQSLKTELDKLQKAAGGSSKPETVFVKPVDPHRAMQGEGDMCINVLKYVDSNKWYKRPAIATPTNPNKHETAKAEQKARDNSLVKQVREIYENQYGVIDTNHRQQALQPVKKNPVAELMKGAKPKQVVQGESDVDLGDALAKHENEQSYRYKSDNLEAELKQEALEIRTANLADEIAVQEKEAHIAQADTAAECAGGKQHIMGPSSTTSQTSTGFAESKHPVESSSNLGTKTVMDHLHDTATPKGQTTTITAPTVQWEEPPVYKVLAYDSGNDSFSTATTTSNFAGTETPISIPEALSQLYYPARFVSHFADLQKDGYQVIYGTRDLLVFKKIRAMETLSTEQTAMVDVVEPSLIDHSLIKPMENALAEEAANFYDRYKPKPRSYDPTSIENGKLMPYENLLAQEAANFHDQKPTIINPIDGTMRTSKEPVSTGNFASPTGFVNHDPVFPSDAISTTNLAREAQESERQLGPRETMQRTVPQEDNDEDITYVHYPRVRREEPVFSGTRRAGPTWNKRQERHQRKAEQSHNSENRKRRGGTVKWALSVGVGAAGVAYMFGVAAEAARQKKLEKEKERWQQVVEGKRRWWE